MAISYPGISYLTGYQPKNALEEFAKGFGFGEGIKNEQQAKSALAAYVDSLTGGGAVTAPMPSAMPASDRMVMGSHAAAEGATDPGLVAYFNAARKAESGGNDAARNPNSTATGRYQFLESTWNDLAQRNPNLGLTPDGRTDPAQQERAMRAFTAENARTLSASGVPVNPGTLYAAHFLGPKGAADVLRMPDDAPMMAAVGPEVVRANPHLANMTVGQFKQWASEKGGGGNGGYAPPTMQTAAGGPATSPQRPPPEILKALITNPATREFGLQLAMGTAGTTKGVVINGKLVNPMTGQVMGDYSDTDAKIGLNQVWGTDAEGNPVLGQMSDDGRFVPTQLPEGVRPMDPRTLAGERAFGTESGKRAAERIDQLPSLLAKSDDMLSTIDGILEDPALDVSTGWLAWMQGVPGTDQYRFGQRALQLQGQAFLQAFESLKGGGQITEVEGTKATQAIGRLSTAQSANDYRTALGELKGIIEAAKRRTQERAGFYTPPAGAGVADDPLGLR